MKWEKAQDIKEELEKILKKIDFPHIDIERVVCFRSFGSKSSARARIWSLPRVWQKALNVKAHYVIEVLSEKFDRLSLDDQKRVLIHELLHIPKTFSGSLRPHRGRTWKLDQRMVERLFKEYKGSIRRHSDPPSRRGRISELVSVLRFSHSREILRRFAPQDDSRMISILHGDNILASRKALESAKLAASEKEIIKLEGKKTDLPLLKQALEAKSLFAENKLVVVEDLITENRKQITENVINYLIEGKFDADLLLWEGKPLPTGILSKFKKIGSIRIQLFKQPVVIFKFLDSLKPGNTKAMLATMLRSMEALEAEVVFYMLVRQFRILLAVKAKEKDRTIERNNDIEELKKLAAWQLGKLKRQASYFSLEQLLKIYKELLIIDYQVKTGKSALDLTKRMELFIMSL